MPAPFARLAPLAATLALAVGVTGCGDQRGGDHGGSGCSGGGIVCSIDATGPTTYDLDQLGTKVVISDLRPGTVHVRIARDEATLRRGVPTRLHGFLMTATDATADHVALRVER